MDRRLRELERLEAGGDPAAAAALLSARVRAGSIPPERLALAAFLGDARARRVVGRRGRQPSKYRGRWLRGLVGFSPETAERVLLILHQMIAGLPLELPPCRPRVGSWYESHPLPTSFADTLAAAERWAAARDLADRRRVLEGVARYERDCASDEGDGWWAPRWPTCALGELVHGQAARAAEGTFRDAVAWRATITSRWHRAQVEHTLRAELARLLVAWALG